MPNAASAQKVPRQPKIAIATDTTDSPKAAPTRDPTKSRPCARPRSGGGIQL